MESNFDVISMSESTTSTNKKAKDSNDLAMTKKKLKVLKQALKEEKEQSGAKDKNLQEVKTQIDVLKKQIEDKDKKYEQLLQDKRNIEDSLLRDGQPKKGKKDDGSDVKRQLSNNEPKPIPVKVEKSVEEQSQEVSLLKATIEAFKLQI